METAKIDQTKEWTVDDYLMLGDDLLAQLINGELIMSPAPNTNHQRVLRSLFKVLDELALNGELFFAPIDLYADRTNVFQPDLVFVAEAQKSIITERGIEGAPALIVEVVSPSNSFVDRNLKRHKYLEIGVAEYWIVDPGNKTLEIYTTNTDKPSLYLAGEGKVTSNILGNRTFDLQVLF
ncbi:MAG: Uma2 family endonuclease [Marinoscillum sp.]